VRLLVYSLLKSVANLVSCYTARKTEPQAAKLPYQESVQGHINNDSEEEGNCVINMPAVTPKVLKLLAYDWGGGGGKTEKKKTLGGKFL